MPNPAENLPRPLGHEVVKWDNSLNHLDFAALTVMEMNLFTAICAQVVERETTEVHLSYSLLKELMQFKSTSKQRFIKTLIKGTRHLRAFAVSYEHGTKIGAGQLFYNLEADKITGDLDVAVNEKVLGVLNNLTDNFTMFLQPNWVQITSKYAKIAYLIIMEWRKTGREIIIPMTEFRQRLNVPKTMTTNDITKRVLQPIEEQLTQHQLIKDLQITPIRTGHRYVAYKFTFAPMPLLAPITPSQTDRINRLTEIARTKTPAGKTMYRKDDRAIVTDATLTTAQKNRKLAAAHAHDEQLVIPLFKLGDE